MKLAASGLGMSALVSAILTAWILVGLGGLAYYRTPLRVRGYAPAHRMLRPSGPAGQTFGIVGALLMTVPFIYMLRKRVRRFRAAGSLKTWLEIHLFCGIVGPVLVTFHTSFKFNGIVSAAYWSMAIVVLSGFAGRYLYVQIPRSIRGGELNRAELDRKAEELHEHLLATASPETMTRLHAFEQAVVPERRENTTLRGLFFGDRAVSRGLRRLAGELESAGLPSDLRERTLSLVSERAMLLRRIAYLQKTKKLFDMWHVFHLPLVYIMLAIVSVHVAVVLYLGYVPFRW